MKENNFEVAIKAIMLGYEDYKDGVMTADDFIEHVHTCCLEAETYHTN